MGVLDAAVNAVVMSMVTRTVYLLRSGAAFTSVWSSRNSLAVAQEAAIEGHNHSMPVD